MAHAFDRGNLLKCHLKGKSCRKLANELNYYDLKKTLTPGVILTLPWGYIHIAILVKQVYWYFRSQVSVYRTIGPLVLYTDRKTGVYRGKPNFLTFGPWLLVRTVYPQSMF